MRSNWTAASLDDLVDDIIDRRGVTPRKLGSDFTSHGHRVVSAKLIKQNRVDLTAAEPRFVDEATYQRWMKTPMLPDDVILTSEAPLGEVAYVKNELPWCAGQRLFVIRTDKARLLGRYLFYALRGGPVRHDLLSRATGTTAQGIRQTELRKVNVPVPPIPEQEAIAEVLGALDDKIELNERMNATLDETARALFKSWFVDFDPVRAKAEGRQPSHMDATTAALFPDSFEDSPLGRIPVGWRREPLSERVAILSGGTPKRSVAAYWDGGVPWASVPDVRGGIFIAATVETITEEGVKNSAAKILPKGTVVVTARGTVGEIAMLAESGAINQSCYGLADSCGAQLWLYRTIERSIVQMRRAAHGSVFDTINKATFDHLDAIIPLEELVTAFESTVAPCHDLILLNTVESRTLAELRDTLLPKLISGELRVGDAERVVEAAV